MNSDAYQDNPFLDESDDLGDFARPDQQNPFVPCFEGFGESVEVPQATIVYESNITAYEAFAHSTNDSSSMAGLLTSAKAHSNPTANPIVKARFWGR